ncbi:MAG: hypothetical protein J7L03_06540 [Caldisericaceae bacterium]|nr:hypothetical protein [Caldisericaceae bacterium]
MDKFEDVYEALEAIENGVINIENAKKMRMWQLLDLAEEQIQNGYNYIEKYIDNKEANND